MKNGCCPRSWLTCRMWAVIHESAPVLARKNFLDLMKPLALLALPHCPFQVGPRWQEEDHGDVQAHGIIIGSQKIRNSGLLWTPAENSKKSSPESLGLCVGECACMCVIVTGYDWWPQKNEWAEGRMGQIICVEKMRFLSFGATPVVQAPKHRGVYAVDGDWKIFEVGQKMRLK